MKISQLKFPSDKLPSILLYLGAFLVPLKLSLAYICFIILLLLSIKDLYTSEVTKRYGWFLAPIAAFLTTLLCSSLLGVTPLEGVRGILSFSAGIVLALITAEKIRNHKISFELLFSTLLLGQSIAALHTVLDYSSITGLKRLFLGAVTESGQLALTLPLAAGVLISRSKNITQDSAKIFAVSLLLAALAFSGAFWINATLIIGIAAFAGYSIAVSYKKNSLDSIRELVIAFLPFIIGILLAALILNLKRGPWLGIVVAFGILAFYLRPVIGASFFAILLAALGLFSEVRERLLDSIRDFTIAGGRQEIWDIGLFLMDQFPTGIGFKSSKFLHTYAIQVPPELNHFHSNILNIAVEGGLFAVGLFFLWLVIILKNCFANSEALINNINYRPLLIGIGSAIISWQCAGLVEYNVGDSEVMYVVFLCMGITLGILSRASPTSFDIKKS